MSHVIVIDAALRNTKVKVDGGKYMTDVVEDACRQLKISNKTFDLKYKDKTIDLSLTFRATGLPAGARLELVIASSSPSVVSVALQLPEVLGSARFVDKFRSDTTLWKILRKFEEANNIELTDRPDTQIESGQVSGPGRIYYLQPVLNISNREAATLPELNRTLASYGMKDKSILIKLAFRKTQVPFEEAMAINKEYFKEDDVVVPVTGTPQAQTSYAQSEPAHSIPATSTSSNINDKPILTASEDSSQFVPTLPTPTGTAPIQIAVVGTGPFVGRNGRPITVYGAPSSAIPKAALLNEREVDFEPTPAHARSALGRLNTSHQNKQLPSDAQIEQLEREQLAKLSAISEVQIRVKFPDSSLISYIFTAEDSANDVYDHVTDAIVEDKEPFTLRYFGDRAMEALPRNGKKLITDLKIRRKSQMHLEWLRGAVGDGRKVPTLKAHYLAQAREISGPSAVEEEADEITSLDKKDKDKKPSGGGLGKLGKFFPGTRNK